MKPIASLAVVSLLALACCVSHSSVAAQGKDVNPLFPDGIAHDFGKVKRGTPLKHDFRIVNTTNAPLHIVEVRRGG